MWPMKSFFEKFNWGNDDGIMLKNNYTKMYTYIEQGLNHVT